MLPITQDLLTNSRNRPFLRDATGYSIRKLKGIIAHWTANTDKGATAKANRNYFNNTDRYASAHYIVDDRSIIQCLRDNEVGYHVGANSYKPDGERIRESTALTPNYFVIGFEMCVNKDGNWNKTYRNSVDLAAHLLRKYRFSINDLYRHFDITGKDCPNMMLDENKWQAFKKDIALEMANDPAPPIAQGIVTAAGLNVRTGPGVQNPAVTKLLKSTSIDIYEEKDGWLRIGPGRWVSKNYVQITFRTQLARVVSTTGANVRKNATTQSAEVDALPNGVWIDIIDRQPDWYALGTNRWVHASLLEIIDVQDGEVTGTNDLNVRSGPATTFPIVRKLKLGDRVQIIEVQDDWLRIGTNEWAYNRFVMVNG